MGLEEIMLEMLQGVNEGMLYHQIMVIAKFRPAAIAVQSPVIKSLGVGCCIDQIRKEDTDTKTSDIWRIL